MRTSSSEFAARARAALVFGLFLSAASAASQSSALYGASPGTAEAGVQGSLLSLSNEMLQAQWSVA